MLEIGWQVTKYSFQMEKSTNTMEVAGKNKQEL